MLDSIECSSKTLKALKPIAYATTNTHTHTHKTNFVVKAKKETSKALILA